MGLPYSKQVYAAFDQVTPLVEAGFEVLRTTKNITFLLAAIQVITVLLLGLIAIEIFLLLISINPDLEHERKVVVTPIVQWIAGLLETVSAHRRAFTFLAWVVIIGLCVGSTWGFYYTSRDPTLMIDEGEGEGGDGPTGEDIEAIKKGEAQQ